MRARDSRCEVSLTEGARFLVSVAGWIPGVWIGIADGVIVWRSARDGIADRGNRRVNRLIGYRINGLVRCRVSARVGHLARYRIRWCGLRRVRGVAVQLVHDVLHFGNVGGTDQHADRVRAGA